MKAGRQGSVKAGRQGSVKAGRQGSVKAGRQGRLEGREARRLGGWEARKLEGREARKLGCRECDHMLIAKSILLFITAGLCEIGGGYLIWIWLREGKTSWFALAGAIILILYGIVPTFQPANFGRVYAAYGGIFVVLSIFWGWKIDHVRPDRFDLIGGLVCLIGVCIIMYWPRASTPVG